MKAAVLEAFKAPLAIRELPDPTPPPGGAVIRMEANGVCRSDWHLWFGDWTWVKLPWVMGHECAGVVEAVSPEVRHFKPGDRVIVPFSAGDGTCEHCLQGHSNVCDHFNAIGINHWGAMARYAAVPNADLTLVHLPEALSFVEGASMGCRYMTAFHALANRAPVRAGEWVAIHGCGGVGLSAIQIATALGGNVIAVDVSPEKLALARSLGAVHTVNARGEDVPQAVRELTKGGAHLSVDALGLAATAENSVRSLRKRGRHVQIGMSTTGQRAFPVVIDSLVTNELSVIGSFGMPVHAFPPLLSMVAVGRLQPGRLVSSTVALEEVTSVLESMTTYASQGLVVIDRF